MASAWRSVRATRDLQRESLAALFTSVPACYLLLLRGLLAANPIGFVCSRRLIDVGPSGEAEPSRSADVILGRIPYSPFVMFPSASERAFSRPAAELSALCSACLHSEFVHSDDGPCLFASCECPRVFPVPERRSPRSHHDVPVGRGHPTEDNYARPADPRKTRTSARSMPSGNRVDKHGAPNSPVA